MEAQPHESDSGCPNADRLQDFVHGRLSEEETERIARHVDHCSQCSSILLTFPETTASILPESEPGDSPEATEFPSRETAARETQSVSPGDSGPSAPAPKPLRLGRYLIRRRLGRGGFGIVYLAHDEWLDRLVAVKVPHAHRLSSPHKLKLYFDEARLHAQVDHPHIVPIYDVNRTEVVPFYQVAKYIPGRNLADRLKEGLPAPRETAALVFLLADALQHLHDRGLVHRDVKPRNILLDDEGLPYLTDFGLAILPDRTGPKSYQVAGTPAYMAPEQVEGGSGQVDARSDIHALGVVLYEMLAGRKPFQGNSEELNRQILHEAPPPLRALNPDLPRDLEAICFKALAKAPEDRYRTARELGQDLRRFLDGERPYLGRTPTRWERLRSRLRRHRIPLVLGFGALLSLAIAVAVFLSYLPQPRPTLPVAVATTPPADEVSFFPLDEKTGRPLVEAVVRAGRDEQVQLPAGQYLIVARARDPKTGKVLFHEVYRYVPKSPGEMQDANFHNTWTIENGVVRLAKFKLFGDEAGEGMCLLGPAAEFLAGWKKGKEPGPDLTPFHPHRRVRLPAFFLDTAEVTKEAFRKHLNSRKFPLGEEHHPVVGLTWDAAANFAEARGKRLPDELEYEYAATAEGTRRFPWGDDAEGRIWFFGPVTENPDRLVLPGRPPLFGLYSNAAEWMADRGDFEGPHTTRGVIHVVRGGPMQVVAGRSPEEGRWLGPVERLHHPGPTGSPGLGFRCARSVRPRWNPEDFVRILDP